MAYFKPYIDASGLHLPSYIDIRDGMIAEAKRIYGQDIYLENDSADYQYISALSLKYHDVLQTLQLAYNSRSPSTATNAALDGTVRINGINRKAASYSTVPVILTGQGGTVITNGIVQDVSGYNWALPASVVIGTSGSTSSVATCQTLGNITAQSGEINKIMTPTAGWLNVSNSAAASPGQAAEVDSALRGRQAASTANPSTTVLDGIDGAIYALPGVTRHILYENDTGQYDDNGLPPHSLTAVIEGGNDEEIARTIHTRKTPGGYTNGTTAILVMNDRGQNVLIRFYRPTYYNMAVTLNIKQLTGYTSNVLENINANLVAYLNNLAIGQDLALSALWAAAMTANVDLHMPSFSIQSLTAGTVGKAQSTADIVIPFHGVTKGELANIKVNPA
ncbi:baseplate J/gp47 family protein [Sporomusa sp. KB1]|jgi:uncharacterized phage protein gp47/JayE|uniref:baseplate J/gp47 family protein n=1 Tax=Sporomusa sp. KB1 TaxID=943346 RepID=UPI0011AB2222|nr:baseplate J/gp47 family protein [Sporomusa sp. KB1]TWH46323.1 putative phage protein gp47/JayE [Sporomusa sp. KB1]